MKRNLLYLLFLAVAGLLVSCSEDDEPVPDPHEVGTWDLVGYATINLPPGFESNEGSTYDISEITFGGLVLTSLEMVLNNDGTYSREFRVDGVLPETDEGTWEIEEEEELLILSPEEGDEQEFTLEKNEDDELWYSVSSQFALIPDATYQEWQETYETQEELNEYLASLTDEEFNALFETVVLDLVYLFEKEANN